MGPINPKPTRKLKHSGALTGTGVSGTDESDSWGSLAFRARLRQGNKAPKVYALGHHAVKSLFFKS